MSAEPRKKSRKKTSSKSKKKSSSSNHKKSASSSKRKHTHKIGAHKRRIHKIQEKKKTPSKDEKNPFAGTPKISEEEITLIEQKGAGCFGTVWAGKCRGANVAIKVPKRVDTISEKKLDEFRKEVEIMSKIFNPNVCLFMGACLKPGKVMIVTELMTNNVEELLRSNIPLSLTTRMKMARDAALGMAWLHGSQPKIIHRDLKSSNLLFSENEGVFTIKVCDFGLSQLLADGAGQDKKNAIGSPLWMAPEVMQKKSFTEKADVYAFGIMLWEFLTRKPPFPHHRDFEEFKRAVCVKGERPDIPTNCASSLRKLMTKCWHKDPNRRPSFPRIVKALEQIIVEVAISDEVGRSFWADNMIEEEAIENPIEVVEWEDFLVFFAGFLEPMGTPLPDNATLDQIRSATINQVNEFQQRSDKHFHRVLDAFQDNDRDLDWDDPDELMKLLEWQCLHAVLAETTKDGREIVRMTKFGEILSWFGPLELSDKGPTAKGGFLDRLKQTLCQPWFHGAVSGSNASKKLLDKKPGSFLVRFSSQPGYFAVSKVSESNKISHIRVLHKGQEYWCEGSRETSKTLEGAIQKTSKKMFLKTPCPGNPFAHLFVSDDVANEVVNNYEVANW